MVDYPELGQKAPDLWHLQLKEYIDTAAASGGSPEAIRDAVAAALVAGANITITPNDGADIITIAATDTNTTDAEVVRDTMATALVAGANVTITVDDAGNTISIAATGTTDPEVVRDTMEAALAIGAGMDITVSDPGNTITLTATGGKVLNAQTGTSYTIVLSDALGKFITMTNAAASTLTIPPNSSIAYPVGTLIEGAQMGAGQVTLTPGAGVTINASPGLKVAAQYGTFALLKIATDTWLAMGRLAA
jgi:hypothetical protein